MHKLFWPNKPEQVPENFGDLFTNSGVMLDFNDVVSSNATEVEQIIERQALQYKPSLSTDSTTLFLTDLQTVLLGSKHKPYLNMTFYWVQE